MAGARGVLYCSAACPTHVGSTPTGPIMTQPTPEEVYQMFIAFEPILETLNSYEIDMLLEGKDERMHKIITAHHCLPEAEQKKIETNLRKRPIWTRQYCGLRVKLK